MDFKFNKEKGETFTGSSMIHHGITLVAGKNHTFLNGIQLCVLTLFLLYFRLA